jgi:hypothetical protein
MTIRGVDPELVKQPPSGCIKCRRSWPTASFNSFNDAVARGEAPEYTCDLCLEFAPDETSEAIDEAQGAAPTERPLIREVIVSGVVSRKNIIGWRFVTHRNGPLAFTDLEVDFKGPKVYRYSGVPTAVCEALFGAPSVGSFFAEQIERSYRCEKIK